MTFEAGVSHNILMGQNCTIGCDSHDTQDTSAFCIYGDLSDTCCFMKHEYSLSHWIQHWSRTQDIVILHLAWLHLCKMNRKLIVLWSAAKLAGEKNSPQDEYRQAIFYDVEAH